MLKKRFNSFRFAFDGVKELLRSQANAKIHLAVTLVVIFAGFFFSLSLAEWSFIVLAIALVFAAEAFNTALENLTDLVSPDHHPLAGKAKDTAAAAVLFTAIGAATLGLIIFLPKLLAWIGFW